MEQNYRQLLETICKQFKFSLGIYFTTTISVLSYATHYTSEPKFEYFVAETKKIPVKKGSGLRGRVWASGTYEYNANVQVLDESKFARNKLAAKSGLKACLEIAVKEKGNVVGVMEYLMKDPKEEDPAMILEIIKLVQK